MFLRTGSLPVQMLNTNYRRQILCCVRTFPPNSQTLSVFVAMAADNNKPLFQGQFLRAEFASKTLENSMEIPRNAVFDKNRVFTVIDGKLKENIVEILKVNETTVIFSGLEPGVDLVVEPLVNAKEGFNAEILN